MQCSLVTVLCGKWFNIVIFWPLSPRIKCSLSWNEHHFHTFTTQLPPSQHLRHWTLLNIYSFLHTLHLLANPFFITCWSHGVFFTLLFSILFGCFTIHLLPLFIVGCSLVVLRLCLFSLLVCSALFCIRVLCLCLSCQCFGSRQPSFPPYTDAITL